MALRRRIFTNVHRHYPVIIRSVVEKRVRVRHVVLIVSTRTRIEYVDFSYVYHFIRYELP